MKKYIFSMMAIAALLCGCGKDDADNGGGVEDGNYISFGLAEETRAEYSDSDAWQVVWEENDPIRIYSAEARSASQSNNADAPYTVTGVSANKGSITKVNANALQWGDAEKYDFYAFYPDATARLKGYDHKEKRVTIDFNSNQVCKLGALEGTNYPTSIEEDAIVMVASATGVAKNTDVKLKFKPIMTTLEIKVKGQANTSTIITGVSIITQFTGVDYLNSDGTFVYDIDEGKIVPVGKSDNTHTLFLALDKEVTISGNQTVTLTALVPPVDLTAENTTIQVHSTAATSDTSAGGTAGVSALRLPVTIPAGHKKILNLPNLPSPVSNNWITPLDNDILVSQLSIPGTHDAAAAHTSMSLSTKPLLSLGADIVEALIGEVGLTQYLSIEEQWDLGIRAFDIRPAYSDYDRLLSEDLKGLVLWHGLVVCTDGRGDDVDNALMFSDVISSLLAKIGNTEEFAVVVMRHESETVSEGSLNITAKDTGAWADAMGTYLKSLIDDGKAVMYDPELTLGDVAGKILFLSRDTYTGGPYGGYIREWPHNSMVNLASTPSYIEEDAGDSKDSNDGTLYTQDYYSISDTSVKAGYVKQMADLSTTTNQPNVAEAWFINHCSGYVGENSSSAAYRQNAAVQNLALYNYLTSDSYVAGPLGIVMMDYVGARTFSGDTVYGDLCVQTIIDNNYKAYLKRKGE